MATSSNPLPITAEVEDDEFDWEAAVREIDIACARSKTTVNHQEEGPSKKSFGGPSISSSSRQSTLERFLGIGSNLEDNRRKDTGKQNIEDFGNGFVRNNCKGVEHGLDAEEIPSFVKIDPETAKTWIYPVSEKAPRREYQFNITQTALFCNTLVALPTGLGKTFIAAVVMYNYFRWFPEGKIVFAAPSRPLVMQQIEACHKFVGISQEWTIDLTGQTSPAKRAFHWKSKRVFFVTPQVLEKDIFSGSCLVKHLVCLVIDEAHRATGNYSYCVVLRELMSVPVPLRILALTATPGSKQQTIQHIIDNLQISTLEYRNESDIDVKPYVHDRKLELIKVPMGKDAVEIDKLILDVIHPYVTRLFQLGILPNRDFQTLSPCDILTSRDRFRQQPPPDLPQARYGELEGCFGVLVTLYHIRKLLSSHGIKPAFEMLDEKLHQGSFARLMSRDEDLLKAKLLMQQNMSHGAPSPKLSKMLEVLIDHFKTKDSLNSRVIIFSNFRGSVRDIMSALRSIQEYVKATEFIGQSSGKSLKGQSQKVQQAVLEKFRAGGYNVIVATSIGEEGLDIMEVDLVICFDANISPLRMIQRMGRTGRKHEGRVVVLACEGSELRGYLRKQANSKVMNKHLRNGGTTSFNFHSSPRMIPHVYKPEVQVAELSIQQFVPRAKKVFEDQSMETSSYMAKLTDSESHLIARYFNSSQEDAWRTSLIAFPHFQAFPSRVYRVVHSFRTRMLVDAMQLLQDVSCSKDYKDFDILDRACSDQQAREAAKLSSQLHVGSPVSDMNMCSNVAVDCKGGGFNVNEENMAEVKIEGNGCKQRSRTDSLTHAFLFDSGYVSVDCLGKVEVSSVPHFPWILFSQETCGSPSKTGHSFHSIQDPVQFRDSEEAYDLSVAQVEFNGDVEARSTTRNIVSASVKDLITNKTSPLQFCMRKSSEERGSYGSPKLVHELCVSPRNVEFSPRLTNYIESGVVPESPVNHVDMAGAAGDYLTVPDLLSTPEAHTGLTENLHQNIAASNKRETGIKKVPSVSKNGNQTPETKVDDMAPVCKSNTLSLEETRPQVEKPDTCFPEDPQLSSGGVSESIEPKRKLKRLRKHGDLHTDRPLDFLNQKIVCNLNFMTSSSGSHHIQIKGKRGKKQGLNDAKIFIEEEAEVSSDVSVSDDEEDQQETNSCDSFIDDKLHPTAANTQTEEGRVDMMAIYRRSLLSQSPMERTVETSADVSLDSVAQRDDSASTSGAPSLQTPVLDSTARNKKSVCLISPNVTSHPMQCRTVGSSHEHESVTGNRKRKSILYEAGCLPIHNLESEFSVHSKTPRQDSIMQVQVDRATETISSMFDEPKALENGNMFDEDSFFDAIDLDEVEEQASRLLRSKSEGSV